MEKVMFKRRFTEEQRVKYVNEVLESGSNVLIAKKYDINQVQLSSWVNNYRRFGQTLKPKEPKDQKIIPNYINAKIIMYRVANMSMYNRR